MKYKEYMNAVYDYCKQYPQLRLGQVAFNVLVVFDKELAEKIRGTKRDPFYTEDLEKVDAFFIYIKEKYEG